MLAEENPDSYELVYAYYYISHLRDVSDSPSYEKARKLFSKLQKEKLGGRKLPEEHKRKIRESCSKYKGENNPACRPEVRAKIKAKKLKNPPMKNPETVRKMAESKKKAIRCIETGKIYKSAKDAKLEMNIIEHINIGGCCRGECKTAGGYT